MGNLIGGETMSRVIDNRAQILTEVKNTTFYCIIVARLHVPSSPPSLWPSLSKFNIVSAARMVVGLSPEPPPMLADTSTSTWIKTARLLC